VQLKAPILLNRLCSLWAFLTSFTTASNPRKAAGCTRISKKDLDNLCESIWLHEDEADKQQAHYLSSFPVGGTRNGPVEKQKRKFHEEAKYAPRQSRLLEVGQRMYSSNIPAPTGTVRLQMGSDHWESLNDPAPPPEEQEETAPLQQEDLCQYPLPMTLIPLHILILKYQR
jgi:hypothetical protein